jgi:hypothetical protein
VTLIKKRIQVNRRDVKLQVLDVDGYLPIEISSLYFAVTHLAMVQYDVTNMAQWNIFEALLTLGV